MERTGFAKALLIVVGMLSTLASGAQELFVFTEPASNMPAHSVSAKISGKFIRTAQADGLLQRYSPEIMFGLNKNWMVHGAATFSNMFSEKMRWESARMYAKYRFLSADDVHTHFRMAAFAEASHSRNDIVYDELSIEGDQSGLQGGIILTQLLNRLAVASTLGYTHLTGGKSKTSVDSYPWQSLNYSLSAGYLVLPVSYTSFKQTNFNVYTELLGQRALDNSTYFLDLAPAIQLIFNSNAKLNVGYRFQLTGNMRRMAGNSWLVSFERTFLGALK